MADEIGGEFAPEVLGGIDASGNLRLGAMLEKNISSRNTGSKFHRIYLPSSSIYSITKVTAVAERLCASSIPGVILM